MIIRYITVSNFGTIRSFHANFDSRLNLLDTRFAPELVAALQFLLCSKAQRKIPRGWLGKNTQITAGVRLQDTLYTAQAIPCGDRLQLTVADSLGNDATAVYRYTLAHCSEQDATESFDGENRTLPQRLYQYGRWEDDGASSDLSDATERLADTKTFHAQLRRYIKAFQPEPINCRKNYQVTLDRQGRFEPRYPGVSGKVFLSTTEEKLFLYICFLNIAEFWAGFEKIRDLHHEKKPLLIQNFLEFLDESTDISGLIQRTLKIQRQAILLSPPLDKDIKEQWLDKF